MMLERDFFRKAAEADEIEKFNGTAEQKMDEVCRNLKDEARQRQLERLQSYATGLAERNRELKETHIAEMNELKRKITYGIFYHALLFALGFVCFFGLFWLLSRMLP